MSTLSTQLKIRIFDNPQPYTKIFEAMRTFTQSRDESTVDELWLLEHLPVFTQGQAGKPEHILNPHHIPVVQSDRGGQVTYHGPGQLIAYSLLDIKRKALAIRQLVSLLENTIIQLLIDYDIKAYSKPEAPGVYINHQKICSVGLRVKRGCSYHGLAFNFNMDLTPFTYINPCGYPSLILTQLSTFTSEISYQSLSQHFIKIFAQVFNYPHIEVHSS